MSEQITSLPSKIVPPDGIGAIAGWDAAADGAVLAAALGAALADADGAVEGATDGDSAAAGEALAAGVPELLLRRAMKATITTTTTTPMPIQAFRDSFIQGLLQEAQGTGAG